ncbi:hypothetical protein [Chthonobacter rhizosphaerae]|uniref:hypothetical protein n=1 Tax=Chthonobacter rhizosphaerae TaxID=2735553 RepID=UPI0015EFADB1|nr:hypothetical protein [Chthonobacter rhizosphaerae]
MDIASVAHDHGRDVQDQRDAAHGLGAHDHPPHDPETHDHGTNGHAHQAHDRHPHDHHPHDHHSHDRHPHDHHRHAQGHAETVPSRPALSHGAAIRSSFAAGPVRAILVRPSLIRFGLPGRLAIAGVLVAAVWSATLSVIG